MSHSLDSPFPVYVWELPVRIWHWTMALCMSVLAVTGYLIGSPPEAVGGEASQHFLFGYIRFAHFAAAYVFTVVLVMRALWALVGNSYSREIFLVPLKMLDAKWWRLFIGQAKHYLFLQREVPPWRGHNPLAMMAMFFMYLLGSAFMVCTGFAMYGEGAGATSWAHATFTVWVLPLLGYSQNVHTLHHLGMWYLLLFTMVHVYMTLREDICTPEAVISTMINGWRTSRR